MKVSEFDRITLEVLSELQGSALGFFLSQWYVLARFAERRTACRHHRSRHQSQEDVSSDFGFQCIANCWRPNA